MHVDELLDEKVSKSGDSMTGDLSTDSNILLRGPNGSVHLNVIGSSGDQHSGAAVLDNRGLFLNDWQYTNVFHLRYNDEHKATECVAWNDTDVTMTPEGSGHFYFKKKFPQISDRPDGGPSDAEDFVDKQYVDEEKVSKSGDSMTGLLSSNSNIRLTGHNGAVQFQVRANSGTQHSGSSGLDNRGLLMDDWQGAGVFRLRYDDPQQSTQCVAMNGHHVKFRPDGGGHFYFDSVYPRILNRPAGGPSDADDFVDKQYVDEMDAELQTQIDNHQNEIDDLESELSTIQSEIEDLQSQMVSGDDYVAKSGDTMTGNLILPLAKTNNGTNYEGELDAYGVKSYLDGGTRWNIHTRWDPYGIQTAFSSAGPVYFDTIGDGEPTTFNFVGRFPHLVDRPEEGPTRENDLVDRLYVDTTPHLSPFLGCARWSTYSYGSNSYSFNVSYVNGCEIFQNVKVSWPQYANGCTFHGTFKQSNPTGGHQVLSYRFYLREYGEDNQIAYESSEVQNQTGAYTVIPQYMHNRVGHEWKWVQPFCVDETVGSDLIQMWINAVLWFY